MTVSPLTIEDISQNGLTREFRIVLSGAALNERSEAEIRQNAVRVNLPGFRPGKVPVSIARKHIANDIYRNVTDEMLKQSIEQLKQSRNLRLADAPSLEAENAFEPGKDLIIKVTCDLLPEIPATDFAGLKIERPIITPSASDVENQTSISIYKFCDRIDAPDGHHLAEGDSLRLSIELALEGEPLPDKNIKNAQLILYKEPDSILNNLLLGATVGEIRQVNIPYESLHEYGMNFKKEEKYLGKNFDVSFKIESISVRDPKVSDEDLAKRIGFADAEEMRDSSEKILQAKFMDGIAIILRRQIMDFLSDFHAAVPLPASLISREIEALREADPEHQEIAESEINRIAERRVRLSLIIADLTERHGIKLSQDEIRAELQKRIDKIGIANNPKALEIMNNFYQREPRARSEINAVALEDKAIKWIIDQANVVEREITVKEFRDLLERDD